MEGPGVKPIHHKGAKELRISQVIDVFYRKINVKYDINKYKKHIKKEKPTRAGLNVFTTEKSLL
jgi:hypothetical protein